MSTQPVRPASATSAARSEMQPASPMPTPNQAFDIIQVVFRADDFYSDYDLQANDHVNLSYKGAVVPAAFASTPLPRKPVMKFTCKHDAPCDAHVPRAADFDTDYDLQSCDEQLVRVNNHSSTHF